MNSVISHIEYLLTCYECVIIPGFGGFIVQNQSASFDRSGNITPPYSYVSFNADIDHNDGLLVNSIKINSKVSYSEALSTIEDFVSDLRTQMTEDGNFKFGNLGVFDLNSNGRIVFKPAEKIFDFYNYGFSSLNMQKIKNNTPEIKTKEKSDVVTISLSRTLLRHAAAVAVLIFGLFMISHPLDKTNNIENYASFISASLLKNPVIPVLNENVLFNDSLIQPDHIVVSEPEEIISTTNQTFSSLVLSEKEKVAEVTAPQKTFYIIIGSFPTEELANRRVNFYKRQGVENVGIVQKDDKYRLYINSFDDREVADSYLDDIRKDVSFKDAWIYIKRV